MIYELIGDFQGFPLQIDQFKYASLSLEDRLKYRLKECVYNIYTGGKKPCINETYVFHPSKN